MTPLERALVGGSRGAPSTTATPVVLLRDLRHWYPGTEGNLQVLRGIDLLVERGEYVAIVGPSGSGKSTLLSCLGCLERPSSGRYFLDGEEVTTLGDDELAHLRNRRIGFVFQAYNLLPALTTLENVALPLFYAGRNARERRERSAQALERVGLADRLSHFPDQLSGGQRQRVAIARALVVNPAIVLADEPTGALDSTTAEDVIRTFEEIHRSGSTVIMVTHDLKLAQRAERRLHIMDGVLSKDERAGDPPTSYRLPIAVRTL